MGLKTPSIISETKSASGNFFAILPQSKGRLKASLRAFAKPPQKNLSSPVNLPNPPADMNTNPPHLLRLTPQTPPPALHELAAFRQSPHKTVSITDGISRATAEALHPLLHGSDYKLLLMCDFAVAPQQGILYNLDLLPLFADAASLAILAHSNEPLASLAPLAVMHRLRGFSLCGNLKGSLRFDVLHTFAGLESLSLDDCILPVKDYPLLHNPKLHSIRLRKLDLSRLPRNESTVSLNIRHELIRAEKLPDIYPNLQRFELTACRQTDDFSFVSRLPQLQEICFNTVAKLTAAPDFSRNTKLHTAEFLTANTLPHWVRCRPPCTACRSPFPKCPSPKSKPPPAAAA